MTQSKKLVVIAGLALSATAFAQSDAGRAYAAELVSDAGARVSLLDGGSGYDKKGFMIGSADGNNTMYVFGSAQVRYYANFRDDNDGARENYTGGFENNLTRLGVKGSVWDKAFTYQVRGEFDNSGSFGLETAYAGYSWDNGFGITAGQMKVGFLRESIIDNEYQLGVNRSITEALFSGGYTQGFAVNYASDAFRFSGSFNDGANSANTAFDNANEADYALTARVDFKAMGAGWERFDDFTSWKSAEDMGLLIGGAVHWQDGGSTGGGVDDTGADVSTNDVQLLAYTLDAQFEGQGWNAFAAFVGANAESGDTDSTNFGGVLQAGIFVTDQVELFGRWDGIFWDSDLLDADGESADDSHFLTAGVNYYLSPESHAAKLSLNGVYAFNSTVEPLDADDNSVLPIGGSGFLGQQDDGEFGLVAQLQVMF